MKQILLIVACILCISVKSQIAFEHSAPGEFAKFSTSGSGDKYYELSYTQDSIIVYNSDWSVYKVIAMPQGYYYSDLAISDLSGSNTSYVPSISDKLFNSDTLLEFLVYQQGNINISHQCNIYSVMNEAGQVIYTFPDSVNPGTGVALFDINGSFKVWYYPNPNGHIGNAQIFSLPGSLPCNQCSFSTGILPTQSVGKAGLLAYPNPFGNSLAIEYNLLTDQPALLKLTTIDGKELRSYALTKQADKIYLSTNDLPRGTIIVTIYGSNQQAISTKLVKIQ